MATFDNLPHGLTLKKCSFRKTQRENGESMWRASAELEDAQGDIWLAFADAQNLPQAAQYLEMNIHDGHLRKPKI